MHSKRTKQPKEQMYVVRKYVMSDSVAGALRKERKAPVHEIFVDDEWRKNKQDRLADAIGFGVASKDEDDV